MSTEAWIWIVVAVLAAALYLSWTAGRLDRLHARIDAARAALDAQLLRRSAAVQELATSTLLDPAASVVLLQAARTARTATGSEAREVAESELSQALRAVLAPEEQAAALRAVPGGAELLADLAAAVRRVPMARRFHNDAVRAARAVREQRLVRYFRLAGTAPFPMAFEMDDEPPAALAPGSAAAAPRTPGGPATERPASQLPVPERLGSEPPATAGPVPEPPATADGPSRPPAAGTPEAARRGSAGGAAESGPGSDAPQRAQGPGAAG